MTTTRRSTKSVTKLVLAKVGIENTFGWLKDWRRKQQDLRRQRAQIADDLAIARGTSAQAAGSEARHSLVSIDRELRELDDKIANAFPSYYQLVRPLPLHGSDVAALLKPNEALLYLHTSAGGTDLVELFGQPLFSPPSASARSRIMLSVRAA